MSEMVYVQELTQGERRLVMPEGQRVFVGGDPLNPTRFEEAVVLQPVLFKNRVTAYQVQLKDGSTIWADIKSLRVARDDIPKDVIPLIESLRPAQDLIAEESSEEGNLFGMLLKESRGQEITDEEYDLYAQRMKAFERNLAREDRMRWRREQGLEQRRETYGARLVVDERIRQAEAAYNRIMADLEKAQTQAEKNRLEKQLDAADQRFAEALEKKEKQDYAIRMAQQTLPQRYGKPLDEPSIARPFTKEEIEGALRDSDTEKATSSFSLPTAEILQTQAARGKGGKPLRQISPEQLVLSVEQAQKESMGKGRKGNPISKNNASVIIPARVRMQNPKAKAAKAEPQDESEVFLLTILQAKRPMASTWHKEAPELIGATMLYDMVADDLCEECQQTLKQALMDSWSKLRLDESSFQDALAEGLLERIQNPALPTARIENAKKKTSSEQLTPSSFDDFEIAVKKASESSEGEVKKLLESIAEEEQTIEGEKEKRKKKKAGIERDKIDRNILQAEDRIKALKEKIKDLAKEAYERQESTQPTQPTQIAESVQATQPTAPSPAAFNLTKSKQPWRSLYELNGEAGKNLSERVRVASDTLLGQTLQTLYGWAYVYLTSDDWKTRTNAILAATANNADLKNWAKNTLKQAILQWNIEGNKKSAVSLLWTSKWEKNLKNREEKTGRRSPDVLCVLPFWVYMVATTLRLSDSPPAAVQSVLSQETPIGSNNYTLSDILALIEEGIKDALIEYLEEQNKASAGVEGVSQSFINDNTQAPLNALSKHFFAEIPSLASGAKTPIEKLHIATLIMLACMPNAQNQIGNPIALEPLNKVGDGVLPSNAFFLLYLALLSSEKLLFEGKESNRAIRLISFLQPDAIQHNAAAYAWAYSSYQTQLPTTLSLFSDLPIIASDMKKAAAQVAVRFFNAINNMMPMPDGNLALIFKKDGVLQAIKPDASNTNIAYFKPPFHSENNEEAYRWATSVDWQSLHFNLNNKNLNLGLGNRLLVRMNLPPIFYRSLEKTLMLIGDFVKNLQSFINAIPDLKNDQDAIAYFSESFDRLDNLILSYRMARKITDAPASLAPMSQEQPEAEPEAEPEAQNVAPTPPPQPKQQELLLLDEAPSVCEPPVKKGDIVSYSGAKQAVLGIVAEIVTETHREETGYTDPKTGKKDFEDVEKHLAVVLTEDGKEKRIDPLLLACFEGAMSAQARRGWDAIAANYDKKKREQEAAKMKAVIPAMPSSFSAEEEFDEEKEAEKAKAMASAAAAATQKPSSFSPEEDAFFSPTPPQGEAPQLQKPPKNAPIVYLSAIDKAPSAVEFQMGFPLAQDIKIDDQGLMQPMIYPFANGSFQGLLGSNNILASVLFLFNLEGARLIAKANVSGLLVIRELAPKAWPEFLKKIEVCSVVSYPLEGSGWTNTTNYLGGLGKWTRRERVAYQPYNYKLERGSKTLRQLFDENTSHFIYLTFKTPLNDPKNPEWTQDEEILILTADGNYETVGEVTSIDAILPQGATTADPNQPVVILSKEEAARVIAPMPRGAQPNVPKYGVVQPIKVPAFETGVYLQSILAEEKIGKDGRITTQGRLSEQGQQEKTEAASRSFQEWRNLPAKEVMAILSNPAIYDRVALSAVYRYVLGGCKGTIRGIKRGSYTRNRLYFLIEEILQQPNAPKEASANATNNWAALQEAWKRRISLGKEQMFYGLPDADNCEQPQQLAIYRPKSQSKAPDAPPAAPPSPQTPSSPIALPASLPPPPPTPPPASAPPPTPPPPSSGTPPTQNPASSVDAFLRDEERSDNPSKKWQRWDETEYDYISLADLRLVEPLAELQGASEVARSQRGFMGAYDAAGGNPAKLAGVSEQQGKPRWWWWNRREGFNKRHEEQINQKKRRGIVEELWVDGSKYGLDKMPSNRHLAFLMWAWTPNPRRFVEWLKDNRSTLKALSEGGRAPARKPNPSYEAFAMPSSPSRFLRETPEELAKKEYGEIKPTYPLDEYPDNPFGLLPITAVKNAERRFKKEAREKGWPSSILQAVFLRGYQDWRKTRRDRPKMLQFPDPIEQGLARVRDFQRGIVLEEDLDIVEDLKMMLASRPHPMLYGQIQRQKEAEKEERQRERLEAKEADQ